MIGEPQPARQIAATGLTGMLGLRLQELFPDIGWEQLAVDITDAGAVAAAVAATDADVVINLAAYTDMSSAWSQRGDRTGRCYRVNVDGTRNLAAACAAAGKHLLHVSTDYVFEGHRGRVYLETDEGDAHSDWYGLTKRAAEDCVRSGGGRWSIVRVSFPYQQRSTRKEDFVRRIARLLPTGGLTPMFTDQVITPTFTDDACTILTAVASRATEGVLHAVGPEWLTPYQVAVSVAERLGLGADQVPVGSLASYLKRGGRAFPRALKMSNVHTLSSFGAQVHTMSQALSANGWLP